MAILTISRQIASLGDEICAAVAEKMGYRFFGRKDIEERVVKLGFPREKLRKFDERRPGFFASLSKDRDEYLDYLQTAILEFASNNNCILIGRGSFLVLRDIPNHISCRFVADGQIRLERLEREFGFDRKSAQKLMNESDTNRSGFHKSFFDVNVNDPSLYHVVFNTGLLGIDTVAGMIADGVQSMMSVAVEEEGMVKIEELLIGQHLVNVLIFCYEMNIDYLRASISVIDGKKTVTLRGVAGSSAIASRAVTIASCELPQFVVRSEISVVQDYRSGL